MSDQDSPAERFLAEFHSSRPGLTTKAFAEVPAVLGGNTFGSSYEILAAAVPTTAAGIEVLDLACGDGYLLALLAARSQPGLTLCGVDMSASELGLAQSRLRSAASLHCARAQALPFAAERFDHVLCHLALMLMDDVDSVLREIRRVLKRGAVLAAVVNAAPPPSAALSLYRGVLSRYERQARWSDIRIGDARWRDAAGIATILSASFTCTAIEDIHLLQRLTPVELWSRFLQMYNLYLLSEADRKAIEREYLSAITQHCGPDGKLEFPEALRYFSAVAR